MDPTLRPIFNRSWDDDVYRSFLALMDRRLETPRFEFHLAETPVLLPHDLRLRLERTAGEILDIIQAPAIIDACQEAIPERWRAPRPDALPHFVAIDLGIVEGPDGRLEPRLIELQGFSSLYAMTFVHGQTWGEVAAAMPGLPPAFTSLFSGLDPSGYVDLLRATVIADASPDEVILLDLDPERQKTVPDFRGTARLLGVRPVCVSELRREGRRLLAPAPAASGAGGAGRARYVPVRRILHRVVFDELERRPMRMCFDYRDDLDVVWAAHPNWYWVWSKYTLPFIRHPAAPRTFRLSDLERWPDDLHRFVLKPIFSFAGRGVVVDVKRSALDAIPAAERGGFLLQEKVAYAPALVAPDGSGVKVEVRMMYLRPEGGRGLVLATNLARLSRGAIHGVDHNKGMRWVGSSVAIWPAA